MAPIPLAKLLARDILASDADEVDVLDWLVDPIMHAREISHAQAYEIAEVKVEAVCREIDRLLRAEAANGYTSKFVWQNGRQSGRLVNKLVIKSDELASEHRILHIRSSILAALRGSAFQPVQFEHACLHLLDIYGCDPTLRDVTPLSGDGGFDFYALYRATAGKGAGRLSGQSFRIAGQAKCWNGDVGGDVVEAFAGKVRKWRMGAGRAWQKLPEWFKQSAHPILGLFVTTSRLEPAAREAATENVVMYLEGDLVAEDLSASPHVDEWLDDAGKFDLPKFLAAFPSQSVANQNPPNA